MTCVEALGVLALGTSLAVVSLAFVLRRSTCAFCGASGWWMFHECSGD
jgi:hypothetical protein